MDTNHSRRSFIKKTGACTVGLTVGGVLPGFSASGYNRILGANDRINVAVIGVNSRGNQLATAFARQTACEVAAICDVDKRAIEKCTANVQKVQTRAPKGEKDFRRSLEDKQIDATVIATPDHWHVPAALLSLQAGKHVYLEKPVGHNPREGEMLIEATAKYGKVVQIGTQRRSFPRVIEAVQRVQSGAIGNVHFGKVWVVGNRASIGTGKIAAVPDWLDWNLWQGPAPHTVYKDNVVHYNWHWFWHWGTGETLNNGTHMIDLFCWGMDLKYPTRVNSMGSRYYYQDDWETPDTQIVNIEFGNRVSVLAEIYCVNSKRIENSGVGVLFFGDKGSLFLGSNDYKIFDMSGKEVENIESNFQVDSQNRTNPSPGGDSIHIINFFDGIQKGIPVNAPPETGHRCTLLMQLANISVRVGRSININPADGRIVNDSEAKRFWSRS